MNRSAIGILASFIFSACCHVPNSKPTEVPGTLDAAKVLDALKDELNLFATTSATIKPTAGVCKGPSGLPVVGIVPQTATLTLKTVGADMASGSAGVSIPIGSVLTVSPTFTGTYTRVGTQQITFNLNIEHSKTKKELRAEIDSLQKEVDGDQKYFDAHKDKGIKTEDLKFVNDRKNVQALQDFKDLVSAERDGAKLGKMTVYAADGFKGHALAQALYSFRESLLAVDHNRSPCIQPDTLKMEIDFEVTTKLDASGKIAFLVVSLGGEYARTDDTTQTLVVAFDLADSSTVLNE